MAARITQHDIEDLDYILNKLRKLKYRGSGVFRKNPALKMIRNFCEEIGRWRNRPVKSKIGYRGNEVILKVGILRRITKNDLMALGYVLNKLRKLNAAGSLNSKRNPGLKMIREFCEEFGYWRDQAVKPG